MSSIFAFVGRLMLAAIFVIGGFSKLGNLAGTDQFMQSAGLPAGLALPAALFELISGLAIALGVMTRVFSVLLAGFCLVTALLFHNKLTDPVQSIMFLKNIAIAGGFLCLFAQSQQRWSYDALRERRKSDLAVRDAEARTHEAELRTARAETRAEPIPTTTTTTTTGPMA